MQADQAVRQKQVALAHLTTQRKAHEAQQAAAQEAQRAAFRSQQDDDFERRAERLVPNWKGARPAVQKAARQTLINAGISEEQVGHLWRGNERIDIRSSAAQELILKAALYDSAKAKAKQVRQANLPTVLRPGVGIPRAQAGVERVNDLRARLKGAKGNEALKLATELMRAKRSMNGG
jgi:hypothetical protein